MLSVYVARSAGAWVLAIGAARYAFYAAGWLLPWMREQLPPRYWRKVVAAIQGIVLAIAAADVLPLALTQAALLVALGLLAESFGHDVGWLWSHRHVTYGRVAAVAERDARSRNRHARRLARDVAGIAAVLTILALLIVWVALVAPEPAAADLTPGAFVRLPIEGLVVVALALVLPANARRILACVVGPVLGLLVIVKILDMGFFEAFDRPFDPIADGSYTGIGIETLRDSIGRTQANLVVAGAAAARRRRARHHDARRAASDPGRGRPSPVVAHGRHGARRRLGAVLGVRCAVRLLRARSPPRALPVWSPTRSARCAPASRTTRSLPTLIRHDRFRNTPADRLLAGLRGKDVLLVFVESYGRVAITDPSFSPGVITVARHGDRAGCGPPASRPAAPS